MVEKTEEVPKKTSPLAEPFGKIQREIAVYTLASGIVEAAANYGDTIEGIVKDIDTVLDAVKPKEEVKE